MRLRELLATSTSGRRDPSGPMRTVSAMLLPSCRLADTHLFRETARQVENLVSCPCAHRQRSRVHEALQRRLHLLCRGLLSRHTDTSYFAIVSAAVSDGSASATNRASHRREILRRRVASRALSSSSAISVARQPHVVVLVLARGADRQRRTERDLHVRAEPLRDRIRQPRSANRALERVDAPRGARATAAGRPCRSAPAAGTRR